MTNLEIFSEKVKSLQMGVSCLVCYKANPNWLIEIQDILEDLGVSVEKFAESRSDHAGQLFEVKRGRLRVIDNMQCVSADAIVSTFRRCEAATA